MSGCVLSSGVDSEEEEEEEGHANSNVDRLVTAVDDWRVDPEDGDAPAN